jgi:hypothetical protein
VGVAVIDGTVEGTVAVEFESRESKTVRGAILDLLLHPFPQELPVLLPAHIRASTRGPDTRCCVAAKAARRPGMSVVTARPSWSTLCQRGVGLRRPKRE